ncbi:MAG: S-adenosyl-l-methionine hydroxide adenosyltransferase family protein [Gemmatimonadota bacterium]
MVAPLVTLTTDFGTADGYAAAVKGVLAAAAPRARIVDLSHEVPAHDVSAGAWLLLRAAPFFPAGTIHLAVVDPGVGTHRRGLLVELAGQLFVGPDNGLFSLLPLRLPGSPRTVALERGRFPPRPGASVVFDGRDLFAPAAAALANALAGEPADAVRNLDLAAWGRPIDDWTRLAWTEPRAEGRDWVGEVVRIDRFGNAITSLTPAHGRGPLQAAGRTISRGRAYADAAGGEPVALEGSSGFLEIAVRTGSAAERLKLRLGDAVRLAADHG